jgi:hypothetical protein
MPAQATRDLDRRPRGRRGRPSRDHGQRRARTTVHEQAVSRSQLPATRIEHVQICGSFGVEAVRSSCSTHACRDRRASRQVQPAQSQCGSHFTAAVNAIPNLLQRNVIHVCLQAAPGEERQRLGGGHHSALRVEQPAELCMHAGHGGRAASGVSPK